MERWFVNRCHVLLCSASIRLLSMEVAVLSVLVSIIFLQLGFCLYMDAKINKYNKNTTTTTTHVCCLYVIKMMKTAGPHGLSGPTAPPPVDVEGSKGVDPAMASCRPALARQSKPAAAWWWSVTARVRHHSTHRICHLFQLNVLLVTDWAKSYSRQWTGNSQTAKIWNLRKMEIVEILIVIGNMFCSLYAAEL